MRNEVTRLHHLERPPLEHRKRREQRLLLLREQPLQLTGWFVQQPRPRVLRLQLRLPPRVPRHQQVHLQRRPGPRFGPRVAPLLPLPVKPRQLQLRELSFPPPQQVTIKECPLAHQLRRRLLVEPH